MCRYFPIVVGAEIISRAVNESTVAISIFPERDFPLKRQRVMEHLLLAQEGTTCVVENRKFKNENELQELIKANPKLIKLNSIFDGPVMIVGRESLHIDVLGLTADAVPVIAVMVFDSLIGLPQSKRKKNARNGPVRSTLLDRIGLR